MGSKSTTRSRDQRGRIGASRSPRRVFALCAVFALSAVGLGLGVAPASAVAPTVSIDPVPTASYTTAEVSGTVDPGDQETYFYFQYSADPDGQGWSSSDFQGPLAPGSGPMEVAAQLTGLAPDTEYEVRLVAENFSEPAQTISPEPNPTFTTKAVDPPTVAIDPVTTFTGTSAHFSGTIDPEAPAGDPAAFDVNWRFECTPACPLVQGGTIPADSGSHTVETDAFGLEPDTSYEVTLIAENAGGSESAGPESFETDPVAPEAQTLYAGQVTETGAVLAARVNPKNSPVTYQFEWGPDDSYGNLTPASPQPLGAEDNGFHVVTAPVAGLQSGETYRFRVVATNTDTSAQAIGEDHGFATAIPATPEGSCPNAQLRAENNSELLPDCRAYEMVSPLDKNGGDVERYFMGLNGGTSTSGASPDGNALAYTSRITFGSGAQSGSLFPTARSVRGPNGWVTAAIAPANDNTVGGANFPRLDFLSEDTMKSLIVTNARLAPEAADLGGSYPSWGLYLRDETGPTTFELVSDPAFPMPPESPGSSAPSARFMEVDATPDMSRVVFNSIRQLLPGAPPDEASSTAVSTAVYVWTKGEGVELVSAGFFPEEPLKVYAGSSAQPVIFDGGQNIVSDDGRRIYFTESNATATGSLFVRENVGTSSAATRQVGFGRFLAARASDGSVALFRDENTSALMRWDAAAPAGSELTELMPGTGGSNDDGVLGALGVSEDANTIYFVSRSNAAGGVAGAPNLYVWRQGVGAKLIATLSEGDEETWSPSRSGTHPRNARVTPDGDRLLFGSSAQLTGDDPGGTAQVYIYDLNRDSLACVSCGDGAEPIEADSALVTFPERDTVIPRRLPRNLSMDGRRVFFETDQALLPGDVNDRGDVYMWSEKDNLTGFLSLISSGKDATPSEFLNASASGDDVFFSTRAQLAPGDTDNHVDAYDARVGGGFPFPRSRNCEGEACQGEQPSAPAQPMPTTQRYQGPGNPKVKRAKKCGKNKVKRKGKCVKKQRKGRQGNRGAGK